MLQIRLVDCSWFIFLPCVSSPSFIGFRWISPPIILQYFNVQVWLCIWVEGAFLHRSYETYIFHSVIWVLVVQMTILAVVLIVRNLFKWRTLTCQMGSSLFWETPRIAVSPSMCTLASPSHFRFSDSPPLSARPVLAIRVYSFCFLERNGQQKYRVLSHFCLMDWLSHVRITPIYSWLEKFYI